MATFKFVVLISLFQSILLVEFNSGEKIFDVMSFGAIGDGKADDTQAFNHAWDAACNSSSPTFLVPQGKTFLLQPLTFNGNCNSNKTTFQIDGKIIAPSNPFAWKCVNDSNCQQWISFEHFDNLVIQGSGIINGQGKEWWNLSCEKNENICDQKTTGFVLEHCKNVKISGLTFEDSPKMHVAFERSTLIYATNLTIKAPEDSPNTDGIHIQQSTNISIDNSIIQTGDDCISIGHGSKYLNISNIKCGPGHGISIGSLGREGKTEEVEFVHVRDCSFNGTTNGVRIKTWQGGHGYARNMVFERVTSHGSTRPIIIDQYYCPHKHCENKTSAVEVSNIAYSQIRGTTRKKTAVELSCSKSRPCKNITMKDINLRNEEQDESISSYCLNAEGLSNRSVYPTVACLQLVDNF